MKHIAGRAVRLDPKHRFLLRRKMLTARTDSEIRANTIRQLLDTTRIDQLRILLHTEYPADLADSMFFLNDIENQTVFDLLDPAEAAEVLNEFDTQTSSRLVAYTSPKRLAAILSELMPDEATNIVETIENEKREQVLVLLPTKTATAIRTLLSYPKESAGGIMTSGFVAVPETTTQAEAIRAFIDSPNAEHQFYLYALNERDALSGVLDLRQLLSASPTTLIREIMVTDVLGIPADMDQEQVANLFSRYNLLMLPVVEPGTNQLLGVITADDVIDVLEQEATEDALRSAGSDAEELERRSPTRIAMLRLPWIMATMFIELLAGVVIHVFDSTLTQVILLASFMPIISAISGNTGLQSATIIVRGLSTGQVRLTNWQTAVARQVKTTLILGAVAGATLGVIGGIWYGKIAFGLIIFVGMFLAVNIAGVVGTIVPLISKSFGFDPALTSGPFETAFQDVVGISIFLGIATAMIRFLL
ncbi:magnesium transporter [Ktedonospora formicarum]|uniref:Magnesium transporter MgtE n=1 Tax=Ktedonospora formicarum TaxID=2778364 RepID=A0A8J3MNK1_9CHLR|nr:magnesium transporter [Ktedonospora formicarum]GHO41995.1 magnesium transporter MgtE [Ktedonospora formicarum]